MNQFKNIFLGHDKSKIKRIAKPITGKLLNKKAIEIEEPAINFSIAKQM